MNKPFFLLIKPTSADCNLHCEYCFYLEKHSIYPYKTRMSDEVLERLIKSYMQTTQPQYNISWQGGEPCLMGLDFFKRVVNLEAKYAKDNSNIANAFQTNATLITDEWAKFFKEYNFLLGVSLDGTAIQHNYYRKTVGGSDTYDSVIAGIEILKKYSVAYNLLALINDKNVNNPKEVYRHLKTIGNYQQFTPCVELNADGTKEKYTVTAKQWGRFLCEIFDEWHKFDIDRVAIRNFDAILQKIERDEINICTMGENCCQYFVVEHNGDVYPCDFFVSKETLLGNIMDMTWDELLANKQYLEFGSKKSILKASCEHCKYVKYCMGDCQKHRVDNKSYLCNGLKTFYEHFFNEVKL